MAQFSPSDFQSQGEFASAEDQARFANQFVKFAKSGFDRSQFPKWFYQRLSMTFGHIAHYNQEGFYQEFFTTPADKMRFIDQTVSSPGYGPWGDCERQIRTWLLDSGIPVQVEAERNRGQEMAERNLYEQLKQKYG